MGDMTTSGKTKTLRGKYQLARDTFVTCYINVLEATDHEMRAFIGLKERGDSSVPVGTRIYLNAEPINLINIRRNRDFDIFSIKVLQIEMMNGKPLHICTTIQKETRSDLRSEERKQASFPVGIEGKQSEFIASDGTLKGLTLHSTSKRAMLGLTLNRHYRFKVTYKEADYAIKGVVKHIQYDWRSHEHLIGVHFPELSQEEEVILNLLLDPDYTIDISTRQTIDTAVGKISAHDEL